MFLYGGCDYATSLLRISSDGMVWRLAIYWEYDRSTESHAQLNGTKPSHAGNGKLDGYAALLKLQEYHQYWNHVEGVRVLFVVRSEERLRNMAETFRSHSVADVVRFGIESELNPEHILTAKIWRTIKGERRSIL